MRSPRQLPRLKALALPAAVLLHVLVLTGLVLGFRDLPAPAPERAIEVMLVPMPTVRPLEPEAPPARPIRLHRPERIEPSEVPPLVAPTTPTPRASEVDLEALRIAPFAEPDRAGRALRARQRCSGASLPKTVAEWNDCPPAFQPPKEGDPEFSRVPKEKETEFDRAKKTKEAWKKYRESTNPDAYPGLRCTLGRTC